MGTDFEAERERRERWLAQDTSPEGRHRFLTHLDVSAHDESGPTTDARIAAVNARIAGLEEDLDKARQARQEIWHRSAFTADGQQRTLTLKAQDKFRRAEERAEDLEAQLKRARAELAALLDLYRGL